MLDDGAWKTKQHDAGYLRQWIKVHLGMDEAMLFIQTMEVIDDATGADTRVHSGGFLQMRLSQASALMVHTTREIVTK
jgi:hypothetical protein